MDVDKFYRAISEYVTIFNINAYGRIVHSQILGYIRKRIRLIGLFGDKAELFGLIFPLYLLELIFNINVASR